ncbi:MAG: biotin carboxylase N-terminal domain-containing protein [Egibacteraceae bacterium]
MMFDTVLVANRGEIAVRVIRTLRALGIRAVAVYSDADVDAAHVQAADIALRLGPAPAAASYLAIERILDAVRRTGAQAVHPGYGFLAEHAGFARACADAGVAFVGPPPEVIEAMGDKRSAKAIVEAAGVPVVPGVHAPDMDDAALAAAAGDVGYPLLVKAAAGGGGKGMRVVTEPDQLAQALAAARREARAAFGDDALLLERYVSVARHVEVQLFADAHGGVVHLGARECSLQRRHQKLVEECPAPAISRAAGDGMARSAVAVAVACGYVGAGTVEFLVDGADPDATPAFLEMNTRLQVEHPVTEAVYDVDLVEWQLRVAAGQPLPCTQDDLRPQGHAIEARVYAEDPVRGFLPTGGTLLECSWPSGPGVRVDPGAVAGTAVGSTYDPLLGKVIAWGADRPAALRRVRRALERTVVLGVTANTAFLARLLADPQVVAGTLDTGLVRRHVEQTGPPAVPDLLLAAAGLVRLLDLAPAGGGPDPFDAVDGWRVGGHAWARWRVRAGGRLVTVAVRGTPAAAEVRLDDGPALPATAHRDGARLVVAVDGEQATFATATADGTVWLAAPDVGTWALADEQGIVAARHAAVPTGGALLSPMPGTVAAVHVAEGEVVRLGQTLAVVEAMKMEHPITAASDGTVVSLAVRVGDTVGMDQLLAVVDPREGETP